MTRDMDSYVEELRRLQGDARPTEKDVAAQHGKHRLTARERVDLLFDPGTFMRDRYACFAAL